MQERDRRFLPVFNEHLADLVHEDELGEVNVEALAGELTAASGTKVPISCVRRVMTAMGYPTQGFAADTHIPGLVWKPGKGPIRNTTTTNEDKNR